MNLGSDVIIITRDEARKLLHAINLDRTREGYKRLQEAGLMELVESLRFAIKGWVEPCSCAECTGEARE